MECCSVVYEYYISRRDADGLAAFQEGGSELLKCLLGLREFLSVYPYPRNTEPDEVTIPVVAFQHGATDKLISSSFKCSLSFEEKYWLPEPVLRAGRDFLKQFCKPSY